jgi:hypothetical protein
MTKRPRIAAVPMRMTRVLMKTSKPIPSQKLVKSSIQITKVAAQGMMQRWEMRIVMLLLLLLIPRYLNAQRRSRRPRSEQLAR